MALNVAVDIGGTFTDLIGYDEATGKIYQAKDPTTPKQLALGIFECLRKSSIQAKDADNFVHGSTTAINTVIEKKGARMALVVTQGTRDVYRIGRGNRPEAYNIFFKRPEPLVDRHMTFEVKERLRSSGEELTPFDIKQAKSIAQEVARSKAEAVAVCFLHSWANPANEAKMGELLAAADPGLYISLSHEILREYGEYERMSTTVLNSYIGPKISRYLDDLEQTLKRSGFRGSLLMMESNGGVMSPVMAKRVPVTMLESGPVGGFIAAARVASSLGFNNVIAFDMGGTTTKTNLIKDSEPQIAHGYYIGGYASGHPMMLPVIDTIEIGAGGGSIAWIDDVGALKVGPQSAGSEPGPICYGWGGTEPTITDANLICNRLSPTDFLGGEMPLEVNRATKGLAEKVSAKVGLSDVETALAIIKIAVMKMSLAVRGVSVERGYDPRDFAMVAFGGAGPLHAVEVARELHIPTVIVPNFPAHFSALGMLMADIKHDYVRTYYKALELADFNEVNNICSELIDVGNKVLESESVEGEDRGFQRFLDIRYAGQEFFLQVPTCAEDIENADSAAIRKAFDSLHERRYGYFAADQPIEIVNVRLTVTGKRRALKMPVLKTTGKKDPLIRKRMVYLEGNKPVECSVYQREKLTAGFRITGPAIVQEYASTTLLFPEDKATVTGTGELIISLREAGDGR
jgi:N-methylhydantoinase A